MRRSAVARDNVIVRRRAFVFFVAAALFSTVLATLFGGTGATAQIPTDASGQVECPEPTPSPSPTETEVVPTDDPTLPVEETEEDECTEDPDEDPDDDDGDSNGDNRGDDDKNTPDRPDDPRDNDGDKDNDEGSSGDNKGDDRKDGNGGKTGSDKDDDNKKDDAGTEASTSTSGASKKFNATGEFDTDRLQLIAARLRARGVPEDEILQRVYTPFIIGGPAAWTNTWGAPRYGPGPIVRTHEGQDVFCKFGDPVLASQAGEIEFDDGGLGGKIARLYDKDGSYFYYAHLSGWNTAEFKNGDKVEAGDVIGFCGNTGNAITTPPHVHFGWYQANGESRDPMGLLVEWLETAEDNAGAAYEKEFGESLDDLAEIQSRRLFGDGFAPDISELKISSEALLGATSSPGAGGLGLADAALQAALSAQEDDPYDGDVEVEAEGAGDTHSDLAELLDSQGGTETPSAPSGD